MYDSDVLLYLQRSIHPEPSTARFRQERYCNAHGDVTGRKHPRECASIPGYSLALPHRRDGRFAVSLYAVWPFLDGMHDVQYCCRQKDKNPSHDEICAADEFFVLHGAGRLRVGSRMVAPKTKTRETRRSSSRFLNACKLTHRWSSANDGENGWTKSEHQSLCWHCGAG